MRKLLSIAACAAFPIVAQAQDPCPVLAFESGPDRVHYSTVTITPDPDTGNIDIEKMDALPAGATVVRVLADASGTEVELCVAKVGVGNTAAPGSEVRLTVDVPAAP